MIRENLRKAAMIALVGSLGLASLVGCGKSGAGSAIGNDVVQTGIIGGTEATGEEDFSKTIAGIYNRNNKSLCTASILSSGLLLTAAHCVEGPAAGLHIFFGTDIQSETKELRRAIAYETSPLWPFRAHAKKNSGDIALIRFGGGLPAGFKPAELLNDISLLPNGQSVLLAGYGISDGVAKLGSGKLRYVDVEIEDSAYSESEVLLDQRHGKGACHGDSGGPAYVKIDGKWVLFGVTNRGVNDVNNDCSVNALYSHVPFWMAWMKNTAKALMARPVQESPISIAVNP